MKIAFCFVLYVIFKWIVVEFVLLDFYFYFFLILKIYYRYTPDCLIRLRVAILLNDCLCCFVFERGLFNYITCVWMIMVLTSSFLYILSFGANSLLVISVCEIYCNSTSSVVCCSIVEQFVVLFV